MDTIFATATAPLKSGVAIVRISGNEAEKAYMKLTNEKSLPDARYFHLAKLFDKNSELIDEALAVWFPAPNSFTGENILEFHTHGSRAVLAQLLEELVNIDGFRLAEPGEFSRRAFLNGKMDLTAAEGLADLIDAETRMQAKQALRQSTGELAKLYESWRWQIIKILANIEAYIDFPDEDIPDEVIQEVQERVLDLKSRLSSYLNDSNKGEKLRQGIYIVILGEPNVGKSSLLNSLAKRDVAIVSDIAGTTRDIIEVHLDIKGYPVTVADTAGLRAKAGKIESEGIKRAKNRAESADLKIIMFDASKLPELDTDTLGQVDNDSIILLNKSDKTGAFNLESIDYFAGKKVINCSLKNRQGIDELLGHIGNHCKDFFLLDGDPTITRDRHRSLLNSACGQLEKFDLNKELELACEDLRQAASYIGQITGVIDVEEVLGEIFSGFCIGK